MYTKKYVVTAFVYVQVCIVRRWARVGIREQRKIKRRSKALLNL